MSSKKISGVRLINKNTYAICYIDEFSDELKEIIRAQLSSICHGISKSKKKNKRYDYINTVKSFLERYEGKTEETRVGMIGELLIHVVLINFFGTFKTAKPFFNMEEKSITKGFDIIIYSSNDNEIWITEVKSGELHKNKDSNSTIQTLLGKAKNDLKDRLNQNESTLWDNAINGAIIALDSFKDIKEAVQLILEDIGDEIVENKGTSKSKNVILATSLFSNLNDQINENTAKRFLVTAVKENIFKKLMLICLQKNTYQKVYQFLLEEVQR